MLFYLKVALYISFDTFQLYTQLNSCKKQQNIINQSECRIGQKLFENLN